MGKKLVGIYADNLKVLHDFNLELTPLTVILGPNGSGKTSILQAIRIARLGYEPSLGKKLQEIRTQLAAAPEPVTVGVTFDDKFSIRRELGASHEASVYPPRGETKLVEIEHRVRNELGDFVLALDVRELLDRTPEKRREYVFGMLPRERADLTQEQFREAMEWPNRVEWAATIDRLWFDHVSQGPTAVEGLASAINAVKAKYLEEQAKLAAKRHHRDELEISRAAAERDAQGADYRPDLIEQWQKELGTMEQLIGQLQSTAERGKAQDRARQRIQATIANRATRLAESMSELERIGEAPLLEVLREGVATRFRQAEDAKLRFESARQDVADIQKIFNQEATKLERARRDLNQLQSYKRCPTCNGTADLEAARAKLAKELGTLEANVTTAHAAASEAEADVARASSGYRQAQKALAEADGELANAIRVVDRIARLKETIAYDEPELAELQAELQVPELQEVEDVAEELRAAQVRAHELRQSIAEQQRQAGLGSRPQMLAEQLHDAERAVALSERKHDALAQILKLLQRLRGEVIRGMLEPAELVAEQILHQIDPQKHFLFQYDREGREVLDFGFQEDGVFRSFAAASNGESAFLVVVFLAALLADLDPPWKLLVLDNIEAIDAPRRVAFMEAITKIRDRFDNVILAGCPDTAEMPAGWRVVEMMDGRVINQYEDL